MRRAVGDDSIPVLVDRDEVFHGGEAILAYLDRAYSDAPDADRHRAKARAEVPDFDEVACRRSLGSSWAEPTPAGRPTIPPP
jgi:glutathione S-transferase